MGYMQNSMQISLEEPSEELIVEEEKLVVVIVFFGNKFFLGLCLFFPLHVLKVTFDSSSKCKNLKTQTFVLKAITFLFFRILL